MDLLEVAEVGAIIALQARQEIKVDMVPIWATGAAAIDEVHVAGVLQVGLHDFILIYI